MILDALIVGLAAWRVTSLLVTEDGPWDVFVRLRERFGVDQPGEMGMVQRVLSCVWCASVWAVPPLWAVHSVAPVVTAMLAAMTVAVAVETAIRR
jgi:hypothetical protein